MSNRWSRDEFLVTLDLYLNGDDYVEDTTDPQIKELASIIDRTPGSVALRLANYRHLDPTSTQGMENTGEQCREIFEEFYGNEEELAVAAAEARHRLRNDTPEVVTGESHTGQPIRVGQTDFRQAVRDRYGDTCIVCDITEPGLLQAGHILPWSEYESVRGDPANGLLLCYNHHRTFDLTLFTLSEEFEIVTHPKFTPTDPCLKQSLVKQSQIMFSGGPPERSYLRKWNEDHVYWWTE